MPGRTPGHPSLVKAASWSVDGSMLASCSMDGTCKVWDTSTGNPLRTFENLQDKSRFILSMSWGRDWVQDTERIMVLAMGHHLRLGAGSQLLELDEELLRMILDRV